MISGNIEQTLRNAQEGLSEVSTGFKPFIQLAQSTSFIESNKKAIDHLAQNIFSKRTGETGTKAKLCSFGRSVVRFVAHRFDYFVLLGQSTWDFVASLVKAVASSILCAVTNSVNPVKHWRHTGVALFNIFQSSLGMVTPLLADYGQLLFSAAVLGIHGRNSWKKIEAVIKTISDGVKNSLSEMSNNIQQQQNVEEEQLLREVNDDQDDRDLTEIIEDEQLLREINDDQDDRDLTEVIENDAQLLREINNDQDDRDLTEVIDDTQLLTETFDDQETNNN